MRGTLNVVAASDVRWMLSLTSPKNLSDSQKRRDALELDDKTLSRSVLLIFLALLYHHRELTTRGVPYRVQSFQ
jgi:hypothetical protein